jgi:hypothetical protein
MPSSSNIEAIGYDSDSNTLRIRFLNGTVYDYFGVSAELHQALMKAGSKGSFLNSRIKDKYRYKQVS